jgi:ABC-2 type transport system permease protein
MRQRIATLIWKEFVELRRSPQLLRLVIIAPIMQLTVLGYAATTDVHHVPIVVVDGDRSPMSRRLIERFAASPYFDIVREEMHPGRVEPDLALGAAWLAVVIPNGFGDAVERSARTIMVSSPGDPRAIGASTIQVIADGTDSNSSGVALSYLQGLVGDLNAQIAAEHGVRPSGIEGLIRIWFNPDLVSRNFMVPGVLAMLLMIITSNLTSMAIVRERELGTLDQLNVTPIGRVELILGKLLPYALVGFLDVLLVVGVAVLWFQVPFRGSFPLLLGASLIYLLCTLGLGLFVSTISSTQQQAMMTSTFFFLLPMMYLSGFIFPIENMPAIIQPVTLLIPLRYFLVIVRGIFLKGTGFDILWPQFLALAIWGISALTLAAMRSRKTA